MTRPAAREELGPLLAPRQPGEALIAVPAFQSLWGLQNRKAFHKRRYRMNPLLALLRGARLSPERSFHFNYLLFVPRIYIAHQGDRPPRGGCRRARAKSTIGCSQRHPLGGLSRWIPARLLTIEPPFGVSILVLAGKQ